jgi:hypothetical protein
MEAVGVWARVGAEEGKVQVLYVYSCCGWGGAGVGSVHHHHRPHRQLGFRASALRCRRMQ